MKVDTKGDEYGKVILSIKHYFYVCNTMTIIFHNFMVSKNGEILFVMSRTCVQWRRILSVRIVISPLFS